MTIEQDTERMVRQNVLVCLSAIVSTLAGSGLAGAPSHAYGPDIRDLAEQAAELCAPVFDWEEAATQAGWTQNPGDTVWISPNDNDYRCATAEEIGDREGLDPYEWEIFEHWAVSEWLAEKLEVAGERVDRDFVGLCVWGRTCTGQGIAQDGVIQAICREMMAPAA